MKVLSLFSGIGAFEKALENLSINHDLIKYCEIDKFASYAYSIIHNLNEDLNLGDITKVKAEDIFEEIDLLTHGTPCQNFSLAGDGKGGDEGSGTKSSHMWYSVDIIKAKRPKYVVWENVKSIVCKRHKHNFNKYLDVLKELGYNNYYKIKNSKDSGSSQTRERVFVVSIRNDIDIKGFNFITREHSNLNMRDVLDVCTNNKYYIKNNLVDELTKRFELKLNDREPGKSGLLRLADINNPKWLDMCNRVFSKDGKSPTLMTGGDHAPKILEVRVRKLMPIEFWRIQGFGDDYYKVKEALESRFYNGRDCTDSQMYKMAGNSIDVKSLEDIFYELFIESAQ